MARSRYRSRRASRRRSTARRSRRRARRASSSFVAGRRRRGRDGRWRRSRSSRATRPSRRARSGACRARWCRTSSPASPRASRSALEINGVGYRAAVQGKNLNLALGYSHDVTYPIPDGITDRDAEADRDRHQRHRQAEGRPGRGGDPRLAPAGALQGQGREVLRRDDLPQGRQEEVTATMATKTSQARAPRESRVRTALKKVAAGRPRLSVFRSSQHIYAQVIDDARGPHARGRLDPREGPARQAEDRGRQGRGGRGRQARRRAREGRRRREGRLRPRRLHLSWPRQGAGRRRARGRPGLLSLALGRGHRPRYRTNGMSEHGATGTTSGTRDRDETRQRIRRQARPHQPRRQGGEGRPALRLRRARRRRRPEGPRRLRPRQGARSAGGDPQGDRGGQARR